MAFFTHRVVQKTYGAGTVIDITYDTAGKTKDFKVVFDDSQIEKTFAFPIAFSAGMQLADKDAMNMIL